MTTTDDRPPQGHLSTSDKPDFLIPGMGNIDESLYHHIRDSSTNHRLQIDDDHVISGSVQCHQCHSLTMSVFVSAPASVIINRMNVYIPRGKKWNKEKNEGKGQRIKKQKYSQGELTSVQ